MGRQAPCIATRRAHQHTKLAASLIAAALLCAGCGAASSAGGVQAKIPTAALAGSRPIGRGPGFESSATGPVLGRCRRELGARFGVHIEVFAADRVVLIPAGIGTVKPHAGLDGRVRSARCYGSLVTLEPTGLALVRRGSRLSLEDLFRSWGQPLSERRLAGFQAAPERRVFAFVAGRPWRGVVSRIPLTRHAEIVLEVGPFVAPHHAYTFPQGT